DERRAQADARELAEEVGLLGGQAGAPQDSHRRRPVGLLDSREGLRGRAQGLVVRDGAEPVRVARIAAERARETVGMRALQVALDSLRAEHAAVERELLPGLEADDLVVAHL